MASRVLRKRTKAYKRRCGVPLMVKIESCLPSLRAPRLGGGGWCHDVESCNARKYTNLGSSNRMERQVPFTGILSNLPSNNPDFSDWNIVVIRYCDGASFSGDVEETNQNGTTLYFRGQRIWKAVMEELFLKGLATANKALLTGCSAGGLATYIHCDDFKALLPNAETVKCMADGGFFLDVKDISGKSYIHDFYSDVVHLQDVGKRFPNCISQMDATKCFFPEEIIKGISTPVFVLNSAYDSVQVQSMLVPSSSDPSNS
ncbi:Pectin acetylesterase [Rhynchospora pubera]|uniref:Pectin acetylesterase n=1 Tax=Rhynchospora pubera TaxID=906938 RepID=A0AAV8F3F3_9POAL|nr:Pectin acetylesterase [Rhynchospora pubera]